MTGYDETVEQPTTSHMTGPTESRIALRDVPWAQYDALLGVRGEASAPRMTYLCGVLEFMAPSREHDTQARTLARLVVAAAEELGVDLNAHGSWTVKDSAAERGAEADESFTRADHEVDRPDLAIEVEWSRGGLDKLEVWCGLRVPEVWRWNGARLSVHVLVDGQYTVATRSALLPDVDLDLLASFAHRGDQSQAVRDLRAALRGR